MKTNGGKSSLHNNPNFWKLVNSQTPQNTSPIGTETPQMDRAESVLSEPLTLLLSSSDDDISDSDSEDEKTAQGESENSRIESENNSEAGET